MKTKTIKLNVNQVKVDYNPNTNGVSLMNGVKISLVDTDINPDLVTRIKFQVLELVESDTTELKVLVTYIDLTNKDKKYASKLRNWISKS